MIPALRTAAADPQIRGVPLAVYLYLVHELDPVSFKKVKVATVARAVHAKEISTAWAIRRLVAAGYLERGPQEERCGTYRLVWTVPAAGRIGGAPPRGAAARSA